MSSAGSSENILLEGLFFTIEGGEGAGKSTLLNKLRDALKAGGYDVITTREPGGTSLAEELRAIFLNPHYKGKICSRAELFMMLAARAQHVEELIRPALFEGKIVLCDRFSDSTIAYQGYGRGLGGDYVQNLCEFSAFSLKPHMTFLLDVPPQIGLARARSVVEKGSPDRIEAEALQFHENVRAGFLKMSEKDLARFCVLDATHPPELIFDFAWAALQRTFHLMG